MNRKAIDIKTVILLTVILTISTVTLTTVPTASHPDIQLGTTQYPWPKYQYNLSNIGYNPDSPAPSTNQTLWIAATGNVGEGGPTVADGIVFSADGYYVSAFNMTTGAPLWPSSFSTGAQIRSAPAVDVDNDLVFVGSDDGYLYCLYETTGLENWRYSPGTGRTLARNSPAVHDGKVFFGCAGGSAGQPHNVTCLTTAGAFVWGYTIMDQVRGCPAIVGGLVYIGSADDRLYCLNETTGEQVWNYTAGGDIRGSPAVVGGKVFFGSFPGNLYCLNASTGTKLWNYTVLDRIYSSPAVAYGNVYIGSRDDKLYCFNETDGSPLWNYTLGTTAPSDRYPSPAVADGKVYMGSNAGKVLCLNATSATLTEEQRLIWSYQTIGTTGGIRGPCAIANGIVFAGSFDEGDLYAFGALPDTTAPTIAGVVQSPAADQVYPNEAVNVTAINVTDNVEVDVVLLRYSTDNVTFTDVTMSPVGGTKNYTGQIPGLAAGTYVTYKIFANDTSGNSYETPPGLYYTYRVIPEFPLALILPLLMALTLITIILKKIKSKKDLELAA